MVNAIPTDRDGEPAAVYLPYFRRLFPIVAIDDLRTVRPDIPDNQVVIITTDKAYEQPRQRGDAPV